MTLSSILGWCTFSLFKIQVLLEFLGQPRESFCKELEGIEALCMISVRLWETWLISYILA